MGKSSFLVVLGFCAVVLFPVSSALAEDITIPDAGFDAHVLDAGGYIYIGDPNYTGAWQSHAGAGAWLDNRYYEADGDLEPLSGSNKLYGPEDDTEDYIYQILDETFTEGATYTLSVWVGQPWSGYGTGWWIYFTGEDYTDNLAEANGSASESWQQVSLVYTATAADAGKKIGIKLQGEASTWVAFEDVALSYSEPAVVWNDVDVATVAELEAAAAVANPGDRINLAAGTYVLTSQIEIKSGVAYQGAGADVTVIDGNNVTRAFVAWGDRGVADGQVDANGVAVPNLTGPKGWVLDGLTILNCVSDAASRQDILSAARDLLNNYTDVPYTLETAQAANGGITSNPEWFDILSGGADDDLTDAELQAYLDANPPGSAGHLVVNDAMDTGGGALVLRNGAAGAVQNCSFLNNQAPLNSGDGGAILTGNAATTLTIDNCEFIGNSCDDGGGALRMNSASACTITGTTFTENQAVGDSADGGAIMIANSGTTLAIDNCEFNGNSCVDGGGAIRLGGNTSVRTITGSTFVGNYITGDGGDGGAVKCDGDDSTYVLTDCSFIGNTAMDDGGAVRYNPDRCEVTVTNCAFIGNGKDADGNPVGDDGGAWHTGDDDAGPVTFENCLFADNACVDDRIIEVKAAFAFLNCTFVGNEPGDEALIGVRGRDWDSTGDGEDDMTTDDSIIANCLFINNTLLSNKEIIGDTRNDVFAPTVINCLFFGNLDQNGDPAINADGNSTEAGTIDVGAVTDAMEIVVDPLGDYHLVVGSPAIDASDPDTATEADIEGTAAEGARDVGAYEFVGL